MAWKARFSSRKAFFLRLFSDRVRGGGGGASSNANTENWGGVRGARKFTEGESVFIVSSASGFTGGTRAVGMSGVGISSSS